MGAWGTNLYQNDVAGDIKDSYINKQRAGKNSQEALRELMEEDRVLFEDDDDKYSAWFALADVMWKYGHLTEPVKNRALELIESEPVEEIWVNKKEIKSRKAVLEKLKDKLLSELPPYKKIPVHKPFITDWKPGEIYLYQIKTPPNDLPNCEDSNKYIGWWIIIFVYGLEKEDIKVKGITDIIPGAYMKLSKNKPKTVEEINNTDFVIYQTRGEAGQARFKFEFCELTHKNRPKEIEYFETTTKFLLPQYERDDGFGPWDVEWYNLVYAATVGYQRELDRKKLVKRIDLASWTTLEQRVNIYKENEILSKAEKWKYFIKLYRKLDNEDEIRENHTFVTPWLPHDTYICKLDGKEISEEIYMVIYVVSLGTVIINNEKLFLPNISVRLLRGDKGLVIRLINFLPDVCFGVDGDGTSLYKVTLIDKKYDDTIESAGKCAFYLDAGRYGQEQHLNEECMEDEDSGKVLMTWDEIVRKAVETYKTL